MIFFQNFYLFSLCEALQWLKKSCLVIVLTIEKTSDHCKLFQMVISCSFTIRNEHLVTMRVVRFYKLGDTIIN